MVGYGVIGSQIQGFILIYYLSVVGLVYQMFDGSMTMSFHTLNYPSNILGYRHKHKILYKTRSKPALAIPPSSILLQTDESGNSLEFKKSSSSGTALRSSDSASSLISQANTAGIIGGVSVQSTLNFLKNLVQWSSKDGEDSFPFVLCSDPVLNKELLSNERGLFPSFSSKNEHLQLDHSPIVENLQRKRVFLENSGARCIIMPCHISHSWHDEISEGCSVPFLHMVECVARELKEAKLKPLEAGSPLRIGVLATNATLAAGCQGFIRINFRMRDLKLCCQTKQPWSIQ